MTSHDLSQECGIAPAEGWRIACRRFHYFARMGDHHLPKKEIHALRPLFLVAKIPARPALAFPRPSREEASMNEVATQGDRRMTVREVADALGVDLSTVQKRVRERFPELVKNGVATRLNEAQATLLKEDLASNGHLGQSSEVFKVTTELEITAMTERVIDYWHAKTQALQAELRTRTAELLIAAPKAEAYDRFLDASGTMCITDTAKALGRHPLKFFDELESAGMIFRRGGDWLPIQHFLDKGYFEVKVRTYGDLERVTRQTRVTATGLAAIEKLFPREEVSA
jgi:phage antirepressor YoqD-like protein